MRVALFSETYLPQRNGVANTLARLVDYLARAGHELLVAAPADSAEDPVVAHPNVRLVRVPGLPLPRYPDLRLATPMSPTILRATKAFRPDLVHLVTEYSLGLTGLAAARRARVPAVASFHTDIPSYLPYYGFGWLSRPCWRYLRWFHGKARFTFCPSEATRGKLVAQGFRNVRIWGRGVDTERFNPSWRSESERTRFGPTDALHLLYVGRLTPEKDLHVLFEAYRRVVTGVPDQRVRLILAGDGAYTSRARAQAPPGVEFLGYLEGDALARAYASADVFVFPSRTETLGNVVLEAQASGLPVIGAAEGGALENVRDGVNGLLCAPGDSAAFAHAIAQLIERPGLRVDLSRRARAWAEERTWDAAFAQLLEGYREALAN